MIINKCKLRYELAKKGVTLRQACYSMKIPINTFNNWLYKGVKTPAHKAMIIAEYLEVDLEELFSHENGVSL